MTDLYDRLKKHDSPHDLAKLFWNCSIKKMSEYLECDHKYLALILSGKKQAGKRLEGDIQRLADEIKKEKE